MKKQTKILITVQGGLIQSVCTNNPENTKVIIVDYDRADQGENPVYEEPAQDINEITFDNPTPMETEVKNELERIHFLQ